SMTCLTPGARWQLPLEFPFPLPGSARLTAGAARRPAAIVSLEDAQSAWRNLPMYFSLCAKRGDGASGGARPAGATADHRPRALQNVVRHMTKQCQGLLETRCGPSGTLTRTLKFPLQSAAGTSSHSRDARCSSGLQAAEQQTQ